MKISGISEKLEKEILSLAQKHNIQKIIVFGSRARGDYRKTSDIDLAVIGGNVSAFSVEIEESTSTLLEYDIIDLGKVVQKELLDAIQKEGVVIYEEI